MITEKNNKCRKQSMLLEDLLAGEAYNVSTLGAW